MNPAPKGIKFSIKYHFLFTSLKYFASLGNKSSANNFLIISFHMSPDCNKSSKVTVRIALYSLSLSASASLMKIKNCVQDFKATPLPS